jgi:predicted dienelactone hydrolase
MPVAFTNRSKLQPTVVAKIASLTVLAAITILASGCQSRQSSQPGTRDNTATRILSGSPPVISPSAKYTAQEFTWFDKDRQRSVPAVIYLPKDAQNVPLVVFSHGLGGTRYGYSNFGKYWADNGIASVHLQHFGSDRAIWTSQGFAVLSALKAAASQENAVARAQDVSFALDTLESDSSFVGKIDFRKIAVGGHSFGANTALMAAGAQFNLNDKTISYGDKRIKAALVLSAPALPSSQNAKTVYGKIAIPTLHLTGTHDFTPIPGAVTTAEMRREPYDAIQGPVKYLGIYDGGRHSMFNDRTRDVSAENIKAAARSTSVQFFRSVFEPTEISSPIKEALKSDARLRLDKEYLFSWEATN